MPFHNLLLIDDDEDDQEIFLTAVKEVSDGVKCVTMSHAAEALEKLSLKAINPEVIFLDLNMPMMNGQQFLTEIKKKPDLKGIPVIIFSTSSNRATIQKMKDLGAYDFITKPSDFDELQSLLRPLLA